MTNKELTEKFDGWAQKHKCKWAPFLAGHKGTADPDNYKSSPITDEENKLIGVFKEIVEEWAPISFQVFPAGTDSRMLRAKGIHAFGFSPLRRTPILLYDHDEYITESTYREGIDVYEQLIAKLA